MMACVLGMPVLDCFALNVVHSSLHPENRQYNVEK